MKKTCSFLCSLLVLSSLFFFSCSFESKSSSSDSENNPAIENSPSNPTGGGGGESTTSGDTSDSSITDVEDVNENATGPNFSATSKIYINLSNSTISSDNANWENLSTSAVKLVNDCVKVKFTEDDDGNSTGLLRINSKNLSENLSIYLSGKMSAGGIKIQTNPDYEVGIYLNSVEITSSNYPCLDITKGASASIFLSGENIFVDGRKYGTGYGEEYSTSSSDTYTDDDGNTISCTVSQSVEKEGSDNKGSLYSKGGMNISGDGSLTISQAYKNCIASKDGFLVIDGGDLILKNYTSSSNTGKNGLFGGQGVIINDGSISFDGKGIISSSDVRKANGIKSDDEDYPSSYIKITGGTLDISTYNGKGINAPKVFISGGINTLDVSGVTSYTEKTTSISYYDADGVKTTNSSFKFAAEGIEGENIVEISGGNNSVNAVDDAINASATGAAINVSGGYTYVYAKKGDGLDSNGNITITGGVVVSIALTGSENAFDNGDNNYSCYVKGGFLAGLSGAVESPSVSNSGVVIYNSSTAGISAGESIAIGSSTDDIVYAFTLPSEASSYSNIFMASEKMTGSSYTVYKGCSVSGGKSYKGLYYEMPSVTSEGSTTSVTLSNHLYSNGSGMGGGGSFGPGGSSFLEDKS